ncbi:uncharacterized protein LOC141850965 [Brevipalpus obovatus]|uniref:uncharacterized protein LOC141850965 n=1 Tax=Brevipalpus obovatus TaxID=246614 RepID=UPI003D9F7609
MYMNCSKQYHHFPIERYSFGIFLLWFSSITNSLTGSLLPSTNSRTMFIRAGCANLRRITLKEYSTGDYPSKNDPNKLTQMRVRNIFSSQYRTDDQDLLDSISDEIIMDLGMIDYSSEKKSRTKRNEKLTPINMRDPERLKRHRRAGDSWEFWKNHLPGNCSPENRTIAVDPDENSNEIYFPSCVKLPKCAGCCPSERLICRAVETKRIEVPVYARQLFSKLNKPQLTGWKRKTLILHQDERCECQCIQQKKDCGPQHDFIKEECRCRCKNLSSARECREKYPLKKWNTDQCTCDCVRRETCPSNLSFDEKTCSCRYPEKNISPVLNNIWSEFSENLPPQIPNIERDSEYTHLSKNSPREPHQHF